MKIWLRLLQYGRPHRKGIGGILVLSLAGVGLSALMPWPMKLIVDNVLGNEALPKNVEWIYWMFGTRGPESLLLILAGSTVVIFALRQLNDAARRHLQISIGYSMTYRLAEELFDRIQRKSLLFQSRMRGGDLVRRVVIDSSCVREFWFKIVLALVTALASAALMLFILWRLDMLIFLIVLSVAIPLSLLARCSVPILQKRNAEQENLEGRLFAFAEQSLNAIPMIQAFDQIDNERRRFGSLSSVIISARMRTLASELWLKFGVGGTTAFGISIILGVGGVRALQGNISVGDLLIVLSYTQSIFGVMETIAYLASGFASARARAERVFDAFDSEDKVSQPPSSPTSWNFGSHIFGHIQIERLSFGYNLGQPVLNEVSFEARPGETVALVGKSGAGKSTLVALIMRFVDPWSGRILVDGTDLQKVRVKDVRSRISLVLQDPFLLPISIAENIGFGNPESERKDIIAAAKAANADVFIRDLPEGYDTLVGERGATLSGGEKQRIAIARAFLKDAPILILDEPTSALDAETENLLLGAVDQLMRGRTTIIIAHRLSTIRKADHVVVLKDGEVRESGAREELLASEGLFRCYHEIHQG